MHRAGRMNKNYRLVHSPTRKANRVHGIYQNRIGYYSSSEVIWIMLTSSPITYPWYDE